MRILMIFVDMLRPDMLWCYNNDNSKSKLDQELTKIGGVIFSNCYTPAPDTPRSNACLWSSVYPKDNGCDNRLKYPKFWLNKDKPDLLGILKDNGYKFNFYIAPVMRNLGELPPSVQDIGYYSNGVKLKEFLDSLTIKDNSLTYLGFNDFHNIVNECYAQKKYVLRGLDVVGDIFESIRNGLDLSQFDFVVLYSDHGFKFREENFSTPLNMLGRPRTQIMMFTHRKEDVGLKTDSRLASIMDLYPTILDLCGISYNEYVEGKNIFGQELHTNLIIEDHENFNVSLGQSIERWAIRSQQGLAAVDCSLNWEADYPLSEDDKKVFTFFLEEKGTDFIKNTRLKSILDLYRIYDMNKPSYYDGMKRPLHIPLDVKMIKAFAKFKPLVLDNAKKIYCWLHK